MIKHIVVWKLKEAAEGSDRRGNAQRMKTELEALKTKISQIKWIEVGINAVPSAAAWDVALSASFDSEQDLAAYQQHPDHLKAAAFVAKVVESRAVVDYRSA